MAKAKHPGGRPLKFKNAEELQSAIDRYFNEDCDKRTIVSDGNEIKVPIITISGLAYYLGFESRQSMYDYEAREQFSYVIKRARLRVERNYEEGLQVGSVAGNIFALKNMGWTDKQELEHSGNFILRFNKEDENA